MTSPDVRAAFVVLSLDFGIFRLSASGCKLEIYRQRSPMAGGLPQGLGCGSFYLHLHHRWLSHTPSNLPTSISCTFHSQSPCASHEGAASCLAMRQVLPLHRYTTEEELMYPQATPIRMNIATLPEIFSCISRR